VIQPKLKDFKKNKPLKSLWEHWRPSQLCVSSASLFKYQQTVSSRCWQAV